MIKGNLDFKSTEKEKINSFEKKYYIIYNNKANIYIVFIIIKIICNGKHRTFNERNKV